MEVHHHAGHGKKSWKELLFEFFMLFLAVTLGFLAENQREHMVERERAHQFLQSMLVDVRTNEGALDSLIRENRRIISNHDSLVDWLLFDSSTIDRAAFSRKMGAVWIRNFFMRKETYEQMKSSGSLRYAGDIEFLKHIMDYDRITSFAQTRNQEFERKYYTELFIPSLYRNYDLTCQLMLDTTNLHDPSKAAKILTHRDVVKGDNAIRFRQEMGAALTLRLERLRRSLEAYRAAITACEEMEKHIQENLE